MREYDYALAGANVVTRCAYRRACIFGDVVDDAMHLNALGHIVPA